MKLVFIFLFVSLFSFCQNQEATMFFSDGDSFEGYGAIKNNKIKFRLLLEDKAEKWDYELVSKIIFHGFNRTVTYEYVKLKEFTNPVLLELVTEGEVSLYRNEKNRWVGGNNEFPGSAQKITVITNYLKRNNTQFPICLNYGIFNPWKKRTINFLSDCPTLVKKIKTNVFREVHLQEIVEYYNDFCTEL